MCRTQSPTITAVSPTTLNPGNATITVTGTNFATGATVYLAGVAQPTTVVSSTQLTVAAKVAMPVDDSRR
ncbi:MAG: IPT/TIG domain-containing protein [Ignavibacteriota bacterium]